MKKFYLLTALLSLTYLCAHAETIKMKDGTLISGSIISQTEYTLNLTTSYGTVTLNQREIEQVLPDKHRIILKGGSQLVGVITDLDEFNLKLQTDDGTSVNIDMPQIVSVEPYDYDRGENAQKEFVEQTRERQETQKAQAAAQENRPATVEVAGGLTFDSDINQVFGTQTATIENGRVKTNFDQVSAPTAARPMTDEEAFIKGVKTGAVSQQEVAAAAKEDLSAKKKASETKKVTPKKTEKDFYKYFAIQAGAMPLNLKLDNSGREGYSEGDVYDVGGTSIAIAGKFLWRIADTNLWAGPSLSIANIANNSFEDKDPNVVAHPESYPDPKVTTSGQIITLGAAVNYYLNPKDKFAFYLTAQGAYQILKLNYRGELLGTTINDNSFAGSAGVGVETWVDDVMIGLEVRQVFAPRSGELKDSASSNTLIQAQLSWKF